MTVEPLINWFIHPDYAANPSDFRKARLFVNACFLTSLFSISYVVLSIVFDYQKGIFFTGFNVVGYFVLPFLARTKIPLLVLGNLFTAIGATTVLVLTWFSGGMWSAIYPWIIAIPVLALLIAGKTSSIYWSVLSLTAMLSFGLLELEGIRLPVEHNDELRTIWFLCILPGLLLIIMVVSMTFESIMRRALVDVEEQKATIEEQSAALEKLVEEKDTIIAILAHDLRNPLANVEILAKMTREEPDGKEQSKLLGMIEKSSASAQLLVNEVLELATLEQGAPVKLKSIAVINIINEVVNSLKAGGDNKEIDIKVMSNDATITILGDPTYVRLVVENLISNALKYSPSGKEVHVSVEASAQHVQLKVRDYGQGIPESEEHKLFKRFSRLSTQPTAGESSSGLGLALVKRYMELMDGSVWHERPSDGGAIFVAKFLKA